MNTTFFIGNGFDVCHGLETHYVDFYEKHYIQLKDDNTSEAVKRFRNAIDQYIKDGMVVEKDEIDWSDLESALGKIVPASSTLFMRNLKKKIPC